MGGRNRVGIGLSYRPARLHSLAELIWFLGIYSWAPEKFKNSGSEKQILDRPKVLELEPK
jgi:hypothetical protein